MRSKIIRRSFPRLFYPCIIDTSELIFFFTVHGWYIYVWKAHCYQSHERARRAASDSRPFLSCSSNPPISTQSTSMIATVYTRKSQVSRAPGCIILKQSNIMRHNNNNNMHAYLPTSQNRNNNLTPTLWITSNMARKLQYISHDDGFALLRRRAAHALAEADFLACWFPVEGAEKERSIFLIIFSLLPNMRRWWWR